MVSHVLKFKWYAFFSEVTRKIGYCHFSAVNLSGLEMIQNQCYLLSVTWFLLHALQECSESVSGSFSVEMLLWKQEFSNYLYIWFCLGFPSSYSLDFHLWCVRCRWLSSVNIPGALRRLVRGDTDSHVDLLNIFSTGSSFLIMPHWLFYLVCPR